MAWEKISDVILLSALATLTVFAGIGLYQWISRKSLKKVDRALLSFFPPLLIMAAVYFIFDKFLIISTRPNGSGESSFPSSHVMVVATIFFMVSLALPYYVKSRLACVFLILAMLVLVALVCVGRVLSNMHWISDVVGGVAFAAIFAVAYYLMIRRKNHG